MRRFDHSCNGAISLVVVIALLVSSSPIAALAAEPPPQPASEAALGPAPGDATPEDLEQLVSPIALYPDLLVARILVASTFPTRNPGIPASGRSRNSPMSSRR